MNYSEQQRILSLLKTGIESGESARLDRIVKAPVSDFTCTDLLEREKQTFFRDTPLLLGMSADLPENGSYLATNETGVPILMTRGDDGEFRAFLNVCRHRGVQVVAGGRGRRGRFTCPFHAWTYRNSGELIAVNHEDKFGCIDKGDRGLVALPAAEHHGMLWVKPTVGGDIDPDALLGGLGDEMESWNLPENPYSEHQVLDADINWKLAIDTFGENYHFDVLHKDSLAPEIHGNLQTSDIFDRNYRMVFATRLGFKYVEDNKMPQAEWPYRFITLNVYFLYPNVILLVDGSGVDLLRMYPDPVDPGKSKTWHTSYTHPLALKGQEEARARGEEVESRLVGFNRIVVDEDYMMAAGTQRGASSGAQTHYLFGQNEPALHHYHNMHRAGLGLPPLEAA